MTRRIRSFAVCLVLLGLLPTVIAGPVAAADLSVAQARTYILGKINDARANNGLDAVSVDSRAQDVAQVRSDDMATNHYFAHLTNSQLAAMFNNRGVAWSQIGEILAANDWPTLVDSADVSMTGWRNSSTHWSIITDGSYDCAGVGVAKDAKSGDWIWTVEFVKEAACVEGAGSTFTAPAATVSTPTVTHYSSSKSEIHVTWSGSDGTNPIKDYRLQYRINNGSWTTLLKATTSTAKSIYVRHGKTVQFRVRPRDTKMNTGAWTVSATVTG